MMRALRSEVLKFRRWSVLAGAGVMILATAFIAYLTFHQITSGATGRELTPLIQAFPTSQGLITVVGQARSLIIVIALIMVTTNIAAEWSQGTLRNLLVREPHRLGWSEPLAPAEHRLERLPFQVFHDQVIEALEVSNLE